MTYSARTDDALLDASVWHSLEGAHAGFAQRRGRAVRYAPDVSPFGALPPDPTDADWADAAELVGTGGMLVLTGDVPAPPPSWTTLMDLAGVQMVAESVSAASDPESVRLGPDDVPEMLSLTGRTQPGPFLARTVELGTYLGIRREGRLVAMAGERMRPAGYSEISAVCTDPGHRGQGLATRLVRAVAGEVASRDQVPFLHASGDNVNAIRLYEELGFTVRRVTRFVALRPGHA